VSSILETEGGMFWQLTFAMFAAVFAVNVISAVADPRPVGVVVTLWDHSRMREVSADLCLTHEESTTELLVFQHGGGLYAADYHWLCASSAQQSTLKDFSVALIHGNSTDNPMDFGPMQADALFMADALLNQSGSNSSSPLFKRLDPNRPPVFSGHSMGGATAVLSSAAFPKSSVLVSLAPGAWGSQQQYVLQNATAQVRGPALFIVGDQDCCNEVHLQTLPVFRNISSELKALVVIKGVNHCHWSTPVKGSCDLGCSNCGDLPRDEQQQLGLEVMRHFFQALGGAGHAWKLFEDWLALRSASGMLQYITPSSVHQQLTTRCRCANLSAEVLVHI